MLSSSWRVSIIISWNPYISLTAGKAKQELALTIYNKRHRNIQRLSDLPRDTTLMSVNLGREHGWYPGSWEPELLWHLRPCSWCLNDEMPSASLSNAPASSFHWERGDVLEEAEPRGVQLHNADPTSPFLAVIPVKKVSFEQSNSKGPGKSELWLWSPSVCPLSALTLSLPRDQVTSLSLQWSGRCSTQLRTFYTRSTWQIYHQLASLSLSNPGWALNAHELEYWPSVLVLWWFGVSRLKPPLSADMYLCKQPVLWLTDSRQWLH